MQVRLPRNMLATDREIRVMQVGCGATGSEMLDVLWRIDLCLRALGQAGLAVQVADPEMVEINNIGKQNFWPSQLGKPKAIAAVERYNLAGGRNWDALVTAMSPDEVISCDCDLVITAVDSSEFRLRLGEAAAKHTEVDKRTLWLDGGVDRNQGQAVLGHLFPMPAYRAERLPNLHDLYEDSLRASAAAAPRHAGCSSLAASLAAQGLLVNRRCAYEMGELLHQAINGGGHLTHHGVFFDADRGHSAPLAADTEVWATFGYETGTPKGPQLDPAVEMVL